MPPNDNPAETPAEQLSNVQPASVQGATPPLLPRRRHPNRPGRWLSLPRRLARRRRRRRRRRRPSRHRLPSR